MPGKADLEQLCHEAMALVAADAMRWERGGYEAELVARLVRAYADAEEADRAAIRQQLDVATYHMLLTFAQFMATLAVRDGSPERLRLSLFALALAGSASVSDWRDTGIRTLPVRDAAFRLGEHSLRFFEEAAVLATPRTRELLIRAMPSFTVWGRLAQEASRQFAQEFWRPRGTGQSFSYGTVGLAPDKRHA